VTPRVWPVFLAYLLAVVTVVLASLAALAALRAANPEVTEAELLGGVLGLIAGGIASSTGLLLTIVLVSQPLDATALRLVPGRETGVDLAAAVLGMLSLGQALDSLAMLAGMGQQGSMPAIRRALTGVDGAELFGAVVVLGLMAGAAEEVFFRGYMQTRLRLAWRAGPAILVTSGAFALLHMEWIHAAMAFVLGVYLGLLTERAGSALPAVVCHVVNNSVFTLVTALAGTIDDLRMNAILLGASVVVFLACGGVLMRRLPRATA
jgi:membrane protease YdiL (CAAX protease family)